MIRTDRLRLLPGRAEHFQAMREGDEALGDALGVRVEHGWTGEPEHREAIASGDATLAADPAFAGWWTYFFIHEQHGALVGVGGLKGPPKDGSAEIGYALAPAYRGQGLALEAARGLMAYAFAHPEVRTVQAHTLGEDNPSTRLLRKLGMQHAGTIHDDEDGVVWRWAIDREQAG